MTATHRYSGVVGGGVMSVQDAEHNRAGESLEESRAAVLATAPIFPGYENMVIDGLTDDEEARFLAALAEA